MFRDAPALERYCKVVERWPLPSLGRLISDEVVLEGGRKDGFLTNKLAARHAFENCIGSKCSILRWEEIQLRLPRWHSGFRPMPAL